MPVAQPSSVVDARSVQPGLVAVGAGHGRIGAHARRASRPAGRVAAHTDRLWPDPDSPRNMQLPAKHDPRYADPARGYCGRTGAARCCGEGRPAPAFPNQPVVPDRPCWARPAGHGRIVGRRRACWGVVQCPDSRTSAALHDAARSPGVM